MQYRKDLDGYNRATPTANSTVYVGFPVIQPNLFSFNFYSSEYKNH